VQEAAVRRRVLDRRRDNDPLDAPVEIPLQLIGLQEFASALKDDVAAEIAPRHLARHGGAGKADLPVADADRAFAGADLLSPAAMQAVEFEQMSGHGRVALDLVQMHDVEAVAGARVAGRSLHRAERRAQRQAPDPPHAVDADRH